MKLTESKLKELILEIMTKPQLPADFPSEHLEKLRLLTYSNNPEDLNHANSLFAALGYEGVTGNYFLDMEEYKNPAEFERRVKQQRTCFPQTLTAGIDTQRTNMIVVTLNGLMSAPNGQWESK